MREGEEGREVAQGGEGREKGGEVAQRGEGREVPLGSGFFPQVNKNGPKGI